MDNQCKGVNYYTKDEQNAPFPLWVKLFLAGYAALFVIGMIIGWESLKTGAWEWQRYYFKG